MWAWHDLQTPDLPVKALTTLDQHGRHTKQFLEGELGEASLQYFLAIGFLFFVPFTW